MFRYVEEKKIKSQICLDSTPRKHKKHPCGHYGGRRAMEQKTNFCVSSRATMNEMEEETKCRIYRSKILTILKRMDKN